MTQSDGSKQVIVEHDPVYKQVDDEQSIGDPYLDWKSILISTLLSIFLCTLIFALYQRYLSPKIYSVRIDEILSQHIASVGRAPLTDQQKATYATAWATALDAAMTKLSNNGRYVILTHKAIVSGQVDVTDQLKNMINENLKEKGVSLPVATNYSVPVPVPVQPTSPVQSPENPLGLVQQ